MVFNCQLEFLKGAVNTVQRTIDLRTPIVAYTAILFEVKENQVILTGYNNDFYIQVTIPAIVHEEGKFALDSKVISGIVNHSTDDMVEIKSINEHCIMVLCRNYSCKLDNLGINSYNEFPRVIDGIKVELHSETFKETLRGTILNTSQSMESKLKNGIILRFEKGEFIVYGAAANNYSRIKSKLETPQNAVVQVHGKALFEIGKIIGNCNDKMKITLGSNSALFEVKNIRILSKIYCQNNTEVETLFSFNSYSKVKISRMELLSSVERAAAISTEKDYLPIDFLIEERCIKINTKTDIGTSFDEVEAELYGKAKHIRLNCPYIIEVLKLLHDEKIIIEVLDNNSGMLIKNNEKNERMYYISLYYPRGQ